MIDFNKYLILIPARKNSKRVKGKNLKKLNGKPLISYSIEYALSFDINPKNIWINSDDEEILNLAKLYSISAYRRPKKFALDKTSYDEVLKDFLNFISNENMSFENIITLQPTSPIRSKNLLVNALIEFDSTKLKSLMSVSLLNKKFGIIKNKKFLPMNYRLGDRHQDIEHLFFENGLIYITKKDSLISSNNNDVYPFITDEIGSHIDIDYESDFKLAEQILKSVNY